MQFGDLDEELDVDQFLLGDVKNQVQGNNETFIDKKRDRYQPYNTDLMMLSD